MMAVPFSWRHQRIIQISVGIKITSQRLFNALSFPLQQKLFLLPSRTNARCHEFISLPCPMYLRTRLRGLSTDNLFCFQPVLPSRPGSCHPIERYHRSIVSFVHLDDVFWAWCPAWYPSLNSCVALYDRSISVCVISLAPTGPSWPTLRKTSSFVTCST